MGSKGGRGSSDRYYLTFYEKSIPMVYFFAQKQHVPVYSNIFMLWARCPFKKGKISSVIVNSLFAIRAGPDKIIDN